MPNVIYEFCVAEQWTKKAKPHTSFSIPIEVRLGQNSIEFYIIFFFFKTKNTKAQTLKTYINYLLLIELQLNNNNNYYYLIYIIYYCYYYNNNNNNNNNDDNNIGCECIVYIIIFKIQAKLNSVFTNI